MQNKYAYIGEVRVQPAANMGANNYLTDNFFGLMKKFFAILLP